MIKIIYFILIITTFVVLSSLLITLVIYRKQFAKRIENTKEDIQIKGINKRKMHFLSGKNRLTGYIYENKEKNCSINKIILFVHGYGVSHKIYTKEICELVNRGHCVFAYDMTGCGESEGNALNGFSQFTIDVQSAIHFLKSNYKGEIIVIGHSTGAYAVGAVLNVESDNIEKAIIVSGFNYPCEFVRMCMTKKMKCFAYLIKCCVYIFEKVQFGQYALLKAIEGINHFQKPVLVLQGEKDTEVDTKFSLYALNNYSDNNQAVFKIIKNAGHFPTRKDEKTIYQEVLDIMDDFLK